MGVSSVFVGGFTSMFHPVQFSYLQKQQSQILNDFWEPDKIISFFHILLKNLLLKLCLLNSFSRRRSDALNDICDALTDI